MTKHPSLSAQRPDAGPAEREAVLAEAYRSTFETDHGAIVLADLAAYCGFYGVSAPDDHLAYREGMRAAFARIVGYLHLPDERREALLMAAREEMARG